jgi:putative sugar O-methyltransferase
MGRPRISVVVVCYNMAREIPRTLRSLAPDYQQNIRADEYEIVLVDNGSTQPFDEALCRSFGMNLVIHRLEPAPPSPARALNEGLALATGDLIGAVIDGARMASPGLLGMADCASRLHDRPVITALGFHLGPEVQAVSITKGYNQEAEDRLLAQSEWTANGYRLFSVSSLAGAAQRGWFGPMLESNALFLPREVWQELGGYDEAFVTPGGGFANADIFARACQLPQSQVIVLLGEGMFHQVHGGVATNDPHAAQHLWLREYSEIRGRPFEPPAYNPWYFGRVAPEVLPSIEDSARRAALPPGAFPVPRPIADSDAEREIPSPELLPLALRDFEETIQREREWRTRHNYPLNQFWGSDNQRTIASALTGSHSAEEAVSRILESDLYVHHVDAELVDKSIDWHARTYARLDININRLPEAVQESSLFPANETRRRNLKRLSPDFFRHCYVAYRASRLLAGKQRPRILELGAGIGSVARLFREIHGDAAYFICDIPETLIFARLYLALEQPGAKILWVCDAGELERADIHSFDYVLVPTMFGSSLQPDSFDLFMNFHSLGEFDNDAIRFWMTWLQGPQRPRYIFVCNRYLNFIERGHHEWRLRENQASVSFDDRWRVVDWQLEPPHLACPYIRTMQSRYLLFIAADGASRTDEQRALESSKASAAASEMNALRVLANGPPTSFRLGMLAHDLTMNGPLFHLWNAFRLNESPQTLYDLLNYLDNILPPTDRFVEERPFYVDRLTTLLQRSPPGTHPDIEHWLAEAQATSKTAHRRIALVTSYHGYNLVEIDDTMIAVRQDLGPIDLQSERLGEREFPPYILKADAADPSLRVHQLEQKIEALLGR